MKIAIVITLPLKVKCLTKIRSFCGHRKGATTLSKITLGITTLDTMPFSNMTLSIIILFVAVLSIKTLSITVKMLL